MKKYVIVSCIFLVVSSSVFAAELKSIENVKWKWVEVLNKHIESGNGEFGLDHLGVDRYEGRPYIDNVCGIGRSDVDQFNNKVKIIGELSDGEYIFEYTRDGVAFGSPCPSGVFFKARLEDIVK